MLLTVCEESEKMCYGTWGFAKISVKLYEIHSEIRQGVSLGTAPHICQE